MTRREFVLIVVPYCSQSGGCHTARRVGCDQTCVVHIGCRAPSGGCMSIRDSTVSYRHTHGSQEDLQSGLAEDASFAQREPRLVVIFCCTEDWLARGWCC